jgi:putative ABC transport system permease protein
MGQFLAVLPVTLGNIGKRLGSSLVTIVGVAGVVGVVISMLAMAQGLRHTMAATGRADRAIILSKGAPVESASNLSRDTLASAMESAGIARGTDGKPLASRELLVQLRLPGRDGVPGVVSVRGIDRAGVTLRPEIRLIQGRMFQPGRRELVVGRALIARFPRLMVGKSVRIEDSDWFVTGSFTADGDAHESEALGDGETLLSATHRSNFQSMTVALENPGTLIRVEASLEVNPLLAAEAQREDLFYAARSQGAIRVLTGIGLVVGAIMAIGAVFAAFNTMYAAVAAEAGLIATLRAIGFKSWPVLFAVFAEALILALLGAALGGLVAALLFQGHELSATGNQAQLFYTMRISPVLMVTGVFWALAIGLIGGLFPAIRAARLPVAEALRAA